MTAALSPFRAQGTVPAQPSKSAAHRLLICAALADRETEVALSGTNADIGATLRCLEALGAGVRRTENGVRIAPVRAGGAAVPQLCCGESGSTLRFLLPVAAALDGAAFSGEGRLPERPLSELTAQLRAHGASVSADRLPLRVSGGLRAGVFSLPGNVSSQYFTGLMLAAPLLGDTEIRIEGKLESAGYIRMTRDAMALFGVRTEVDGRRILIPGGQRYSSPGFARAEGDWSGAAFPLALGALGGPVTVTGLKPDSLQGDRQIVSVLQEAGAKVTWAGDAVTVSGPARLRGVTADVSGIPDLAPALAAVLMHASGESALTNAGRLRLKESDRLEGIRAMVEALGGDAQIRGDTLIVRGREACPGGQARGFGDHRLVMAAAVAASRCMGMSSVTDGEAVAKSYPGFFEDLRILGGQTDGVDVR